MSFESLGLSADLARAVADKGYGEPTPIQRQAIPVILEGRDILAGAQTGTGKTAGFTLPLLQRLNANAEPGAKAKLRALILTPTRELAAQVEESVRSYGKYLPLKSTVIFGGVGFTPQAERLRQGVDVLVATPGRLLDHVQQRTIDLSHIEILVLDEADRMLDMGFIRDIRRILALLPPARQNLLFSATYSDEIKALADGLLKDPALIEVARRNTAAELVKQVVHPVDRMRKRELLSHLVHAQGWKQVLVFTRTKHGANRLAEQLEKDGITSAAIHGNKSQGARTKALADFKANTVRVLVATDIAARGLDIDQLPHVVNYELPNVPEDYVHRIGRTGRAGNEGEAVSLVCVDEKDFLRDIERLVKHEIPKVVIEGFEPDPSINPEPVFQGRGQRQRHEGRPSQGRKHHHGQPRQHQRQHQNQNQPPRQRAPHSAPHQAPFNAGGLQNSPETYPGNVAEEVEFDENDNRGNRITDDPTKHGNRNPFANSGRSNKGARFGHGKTGGHGKPGGHGQPRGHGKPKHNGPRKDGPRRGKSEVPAIFLNNRRDD